jgi:HPt (histidine-containing phosphotransfer) domain-containing protein
MEEEIQALMNKIGFDYQTTSELLETFIEQMRCGVNDMESLVLVLDYERIARKAHQLKGAAAAVRIERLRRYLEEIELALKQSDLVRINELIDIIKKEPLIQRDKGDPK